MKRKKKDGKYVLYDVRHYTSNWEPIYKDQGGNYKVKVLLSSGFFSFKCPDGVEMLGRTTIVRRDYTRFPLLTKLFPAFFSIKSKYRLEVVSQGVSGNYDTVGTKVVDGKIVRISREKSKHESLLTKEGKGVTIAKGEDIALAFERFCYFNYFEYIKRLG